ncbi:hypothetical protein K443DRAFT_223814 [Laccaria amethystina LaAM-08-1]|uniref:Uncharacterized protein n=1 Tax=Laccaria amethystina LaAM-08-1 TaxID=1095629 RepID=A0A0C9XK85_9AGAR|nr:hypothetical protein K443DRAFT_223814 [Laccaria amethystina LaAM-08-1]
MRRSLSQQSQLITFWIGRGHPKCAFGRGTQAIPLGRIGTRYTVSIQHESAPIPCDRLKTGRSTEPFDHLVNRPQLRGR